MIEPVYSAAENRYECGMQYRRAGRSGVMLPAISLGLWHNFGDVDTLSLSRKKLHYAFDHGITHFDLANNYGPSYGSAEETFGQIMKSSLPIGMSCLFPRRQVMTCGQARMATGVPENI
jgi:L-glyceraldehyde 3-phosphate reductase